MPQSDVDHQHETSALPQVKRILAELEALNAIGSDVIRPDLKSAIESLERCVSRIDPTR